MSTAVTDWKTIRDDREKYQAYLCSREWAEKRRAVHDRAKGKCERCKLFDIDAVHHVTYARKYAEPLEDLAGYCKWCHGFTHGKHDFDPVAQRRLAAYFYACLQHQREAIPSLVLAGCRDLIGPYQVLVVAIDQLNALKALADYSAGLFDDNDLSSVEVLESAMVSIDRHLPFSYYTTTRLGITWRTVGAADYDRWSSLFGFKDTEAWYKPHPPEEDSQ